MAMQRSMIWAAGAIAVALVLAGGAASAQTTIRLGKAQPNQFAFVPADVGADSGIFKKHGVDLEISSFTGDAKEMQALTAGSLDIALGGGPAFATIVKGVPMKAVAAEANAPNTIMLVVLKDGPIKSVDDLKGKNVSVSTTGSLTYTPQPNASGTAPLGITGTLGTIPIYELVLGVILVVGVIYWAIAQRKASESPNVAPAEAPA